MSNIPGIAVSIDILTLIEEVNISGAHARRLAGGLVVCCSVNVIYTYTPHTPPTDNENHCAGLRLRNQRNTAQRSAQ